MSQSTNKCFQNYWHILYEEKNVLLFSGPQPGVVEKYPEISRNTSDSYQTKAFEKNTLNYIQGVPEFIAAKEVHGHEKVGNPCSK